MCANDQLRARAALSITIEGYSINEIIENELKMKYKQILEYDNHIFRSKESKIKKNMQKKEVPA